MTRRLLALDRLGALVLGAALVALGLLALDWRYDRVLDLRDVLRTTGADDLLGRSWWPWAYAGGGILGGLLGLSWLLAHLRRSGPSTTRLRAGDQTGRLEVDLRSVAAATADRFGSQAPVVGVRGTPRVVGGRTVVELRGQVDAFADAADVTAAAVGCAADLAAAFPDDDLTCRVVLDAPRRSRTGRSTRVRVR